jgi:hypothetical protein
MNISTRVWSDMEKGGYHVIGHAILQFKNTNNETIRMDVSNVVPRIVGAARRPTIQTVSQEMKIFLGTLIGAASVVSLFMFFFIVYHRNHRVMTMAQAGLLGWLAAASFVTISFSFLLMPVNDTFCTLNGLLFIPGTLYYFLFFLTFLLRYRLIKLRSTFVVFFLFFKN